jgi:uncharacterized membrane protein YwaF
MKLEGSFLFVLILLSVHGFPKMHSSRQIEGSISILKLFFPPVKNNFLTNRFSTIRKIPESFLSIVWILNEMTMVLRAQKRKEIHILWHHPPSTRPPAIICHPAAFEQL